MLSVGFSFFLRLIICQVSLCLKSNAQQNQRTYFSFSLSLLWLKIALKCTIFVWRSRPPNPLGKVRNLKNGPETLLIDDIDISEENRRRYIDIHVST